MVKRHGHSWLARLVASGILAVLLLFLAGVILGGLAYLAYSARYAGRIYEGVSILGVDVSGLSRQEALERVDQELGPARLPYVALQAGEQVWTVSSGDLGGYLNLEEAVQAAFALGRSGAFRQDLRERARLFWWGYRLIPSFHLEPGLTLTYLRRIAGWTSHPARRAQLWVAGLQARAGESQAGRELDILGTQEVIERQVSAALGVASWGTTPRLLRLWHNRPAEAGPFGVEPVPVSLVFRELLPPLTEVAGAQERVGLILSSPLTLTLTLTELGPDGAPGLVARRWAIDQATLASWLTLRQVPSSEGATVEVDVETAQIGAYLQHLAEEIACTPREPRFNYNPQSNQLITVTPGQDGYALDVGAAQALIAEACFSSKREVSLPVKVIPPRVARADIEALLPLKLISEGQSGFWGSKAARVQNIRVATSRFNGVVAPAGEVFSFVGSLGPVNVANGYSESLVIYGDRTLLGPGGGVCQVSTTFFRAAFWGGFPIIERHPHSYRIAYYEPPLGLDAAVFSPVVDVKFLNDTDTPILILTECDEANAKLYFRFYGKPTGRQVTLEGPITSNPVPAGEPIYEQDPTLAPGERVQVETAHDGLDVTLYRVVKQGDTILSKDKFFSRYMPWPARYLVGPSR